MPKTHDTLGRWTVHNTEKDLSYWPSSNSGRYAYWLTKLAEHGYLNSEYLHQFSIAAGFGHDWRMTRDAITKLFRSDFLGYDFTQRTLMETPNKHYRIYNRTKRGDKFLESIGKLEDYIRPSGPFVHKYGTACVTASIDLHALRDGVTYGPGHHLLGDRTLTYTPLGLTPDQLFSLTYPDGTWRVFTVEFERSYLDNRTSNIEPRYAHKSYDDLLTKAEKYFEYIGRWEYKNHLNVDTGMLALFVFSSEEGAERFLSALATRRDTCAYILVTTIDGFFEIVGGLQFPTLTPSAPVEKLYSGPWRRLGCEDFYINRP